MRQASTISLNQWRERQRHQIGAVRRLKLVIYDSQSNLLVAKYRRLYVWTFSWCFINLLAHIYLNCAVSMCHIPRQMNRGAALPLHPQKKFHSAWEWSLEGKTSSLAILTEQTPLCLIASTSACPHLWLPILELKDKQPLSAFQAVTLKATHGQKHSYNRKSLNKLSACLNPSFELMYIKHGQQIRQ